MTKPYNNSKKAVQLAPSNINAHYNLGNSWSRKGDLSKAVSQYRQVVSRQFRKVVELKPSDELAHCSLGEALKKLGRFGESLAAYECGHEIGSSLSNWNKPSAGWVKQGQLLVALEKKLPVLLSGEAQTSTAVESLLMVDICRPKELYGAAARFSREAFTQQQDLATKYPLRYNAACYAALTSQGKGVDKLNRSERQAMARQALQWLGAELSCLEEHSEKQLAAVQARLRSWKKDTDLTSIRAPEYVEQLPIAEQEACQKLWKDVDTLLLRSSKPANTQ